jgi:methylthioribulose-1-phosphate dehydratase
MADKKELICISKSGIDKAEFSPEDFMDVDLKGKALPAYSRIKSSAETMIHCKIYELFPETTVILHSHGLQNVIAGLKSGNIIEFCGYEVQKGFDGVKSHEEKLELPIFENSQDMDFFSSKLKERTDELGHHSFLIKGHGSYAWGKTLFDAKRHLETMEYLCGLNNILR